MVKINFISDFNNKLIKEEVENFKNLLSHLYGDFVNNNVNYNDYKGENMHINVYFYYINNCFMEKSTNNIFIYNTTYFSNNWKNKLNKFDKVIVENRNDFENLKNYNIKELILLDKELYKENKDKYIMRLLSVFRSCGLKRVKNEFIKDEELPNISVCIPTFNRSKFFKLILLNYNETNYPQDKIEWLILDDGNKNNEDLIPKNKDNIKYIYNKKKLNLGEKRNKLVQIAKNDIIVFMDDDDYYPSDSLKIRVNKLIKNNVNCVYCSTIPCFDINKFISYINYPPIDLPDQKRVSEATITFRKSHWKKNKFSNNKKKQEGFDIISDECLEINPENIIISLSHRGNMTNRKVPNIQSNGSHYGLNNDIFELITSIDEK